ncbi:hypothetical protein [Vreelandella malpeensis]|uniref:hypothetical protein n=1 Tax=Vreelandella malpeensis TaxID=1172368 RepID=UPI001D0B17D6
MSRPSAESMLLETLHDVELRRLAVGEEVKEVLILLSIVFLTMLFSIFESGSLDALLLSVSPSSTPSSMLNLPGHHGNDHRNG